MTIDDKIRKIDNLRFSMKLEINCTYGVNFNINRMQKLFNDQHKLLIERNKLQTIKNRIEKLNKINSYINEI